MLIQQLLRTGIARRERPVAFGQQVLDAIFAQALAEQQVVFGPSVNL